MKVEIIRSDIFPSYDEFITKIIDEAILLTKLESDHTSLLVLPQFNDFMTYLELTTIIEEILEESNLDKQIQIATFHPKYQFHNTKTTDISNWSNRAPYPIIHLLLVNDVTLAINRYQQSTDEIWQKNITTLKKLGHTRISELIQNIINKAKTDSVK